MHRKSRQPYVSAPSPPQSALHSERTPLWGRGLGRGGHIARSDPLTPALSPQPRPLPKPRRQWGEGAEIDACRLFVCTHEGRCRISRQDCWHPCVPVVSFGSNLSGRLTSQMCARCAADLIDTTEVQVTECVGESRLAEWSWTVSNDPRPARSSDRGHSGENAESCSPRRRPW